MEAQDSSVHKQLTSILIQGSHICRAAIKRECQVTSISRSGGSNDERIQFEKADIFHPEQYREVLRGASAVVYSAGILLEGDYKSLAQGNFEISKIIGLLRQKSRNPLDNDPERPEGYNALNRDGGDTLGSILMIAILVAKEASILGVPTFTYISAAGNFPGIPFRYITSKRYICCITPLNGREAEAAISQIRPTGIRGIFIRPGISRIALLITGLMYSNDRPHLMPVKNLICGIAGVNSRLGGKVPFLGAVGVSPLDVEVVARAVVKATLDESIKGVVDVDMLTRLGSSNP